MPISPLIFSIPVNATVRVSNPSITLTGSTSKASLRPPYCSPPSASAALPCFLISFISFLFTILYA